MKATWSDWLLAICVWGVVLILMGFFGKIAWRLLKFGWGML